jgi:hypothetical protein
LKVEGDDIETGEQDSLKQWDFSSMTDSKFSWQIGIGFCGNVRAQIRVHLHPTGSDASKFYHLWKVEEYIIPMWYKDAFYIGHKLIIHHHRSVINNEQHKNHALGHWKIILERRAVFKLSNSLIDWNWIINVKYTVVLTIQQNVQLKDFIWENRSKSDKIIHSSAVPWQFRSKSRKSLVRVGVDVRVGFESFWPWDWVKRSSDDCCRSRTDLGTRIDDRGVRTYV